MLSPGFSTTLAEPAMVYKNGPAAICSTLVNPAEKRPPLPSEDFLPRIWAKQQQGLSLNQGYVLKGALHAL